MMEFFQRKILRQRKWISNYGDYEIEDRDNVDSGILSRLISMYESLGFVDVNKYFGSYEESVTMLYPSGYSAIPVEPQTIKI